jgi:Tol biopolymer transport system component
LIYARQHLVQDISSVIIVDNNGNNPETLFSNQKGMGSLAWSPDGKMIAFSEHYQPYQDSLWIMNADGSNSRIILSPEMDWDTVHELAWTPDSQQIVYVSNKGGFCVRSIEGTLGCTQSLYMIDRNTKENTRLTNRWFIVSQLAQVN